MKLETLVEIKEQLTCRDDIEAPLVRELVQALAEVTADRDAIVARMGNVWTRVPEREEPATGDSLLDRLHGIYTVPINDGAGPLNGSMTFTRRFPTLALNTEAAAEIVRLRSEIERMKERNGYTVAAEWRDKFNAAEADRAKLHAAIVKHHEQHADDRCWMDDLALYDAAGLKLPHDDSVGDRFQMLTNCVRFIENRCREGKWVSYAELEQQRDELIEALKPFVECEWEYDAIRPEDWKRGWMLSEHIINAIELLVKLTPK